MKRFQFPAYLVLSVALVGFALGIYLVFDANPLAGHIVNASAYLAGRSVSLFNLSKAKSNDSAKEP